MSLWANLNVHVATLGGGCSGQDFDLKLNAKGARNKMFPDSLNVDTQGHERNNTSKHESSCRAALHVRLGGHVLEFRQGTSTFELPWLGELF